MNAIDQTLVSAVERECSLLQFSEDHEAKNERLDDMMMREVKEARQRIRRIRKAAAEEVARIEAAIWEIASQRAGRIDGPYSLSIAAQRNWRTKRARDIDNIIKPVSDALVKAGIVKDDSLAERVTAQWADDLGGPAVVVIVQEAQEALAA